MSLTFIYSGIKTDGCYYPDVVGLLMQQMLPFIRSIAGDAYVFQQDSAINNGYVAH